MYEPPHFKVEDRERLRAFMRAHPLGLLVSNGEDGPVANPVPFLLDTDDTGQDRLVAHVSRANPHWQALGDARVLVVFQGEETYVTPSWYASKAAHGKVVPTWNYMTVQVRGVASVHHDAAWLRAQVERLTDTHERGRAAPWAVTDAPAPFVEAQLRGIVGVEIAVTAMAGKFKVSQNRPAEDRVRVLAGLEAEGAGEMVSVLGTVNDR